MLGPSRLRCDPGPPAQRASLGLSGGAHHFRAQPRPSQPASGDSLTQQSLGSLGRDVVDSCWVETKWFSDGLF